MSVENYSLIKKSTLVEIADAIREKTGITGTIDVADFASAILEIDTTSVDTNSYSIKVGDTISIEYSGGSPTVECPSCLTYYDDGGVLVFAGESVGTGTIRLYTGGSMIGEYAVNVYQSLLVIYDYDIEVGDEFDIDYSGSSPTVECPSCLTYYDDGGVLVFVGVSAGSGTIYLYVGGTLIREYQVKVEASVVYDYDIKVGDEFSIDYDGSSPTVECPSCLTYYDDGGTLVFTAVGSGTGTVYLHNSDTMIGKYTVRVSVIGADGDSDGGAAVVQQFADGIWIGNSAVKSSTEDFVSNEGAIGFFLDSKNMAVKIVDGTNMTNVYLGDAIAKFA